MPKTDKLHKLESRIKLLEEKLKRYKQSEEALIESELRFKLLAEIAPVGIFRTDSSGQTNYVNPHWSKISGMGSKSAMGDGWLKAVHPEDRIKIAKEWGKRATTKKTSTAEYRFLHKDGSISWVIGKAIPHRDTKGEITGYIGTITDITELKLAEEALNNRLESEMIISTISSRFINISAKNIDLEINDALEKIGKFANVDRSYVFLVSEDGKYIDNTHEWCNENISPEIDNLKKLPVSSFQWWMDKLNKNETIQIPKVSEMEVGAINEREILESQDIKSVLVLPMIFSNKLIGFLGFDSVKNEKSWDDEEIILLKILAEIFINGLNRVHTEKELRHSEERNSAIVKALPDLYFRIDENSIILDCSHQYQDDFYVPIEEFMGKKATDVMPAHVSRLIKEYINKALETNKLQIFHYPLNMKGEELWFEARMVNTISNDLLVLIRNITERLQQQRALEQKNEELERYTYTVSHDLKSPLITIKGFASHLLEDIENNNYSNFRTDLKRIVNASKKMSNMLEELLQVSRAGQIVKGAKNISLTNAINEVLDLLSLPIKEKDASIIIAPRLPIIKADKNRIKDVMQNLIENALKYSKNNTKPIIEIGYKKQKNKTTIFVKDNGIGIRPEFSGKIFNLFTKLNTEVKGSGIGLALSKKIVEAHNGKIWVESEGHNKGSVFYFSIPKKTN